VSSPFGPLVVIVNPRAGRGRVGQELPELERQLQAAKLTYRFAETTGPGDATALAREALAGGERFLVAVGGDGTVNEVVNGMIEDDRPVNENAVLGVVAAGSGSDFVRTFGLPGDVIRAARHLAGHSTYPIDAAKVTWTTPKGQESRYFANVAQAGLGGAVVARSSRFRRVGRSRHFFAFWLALLRHRAFRVTVRADRKTFEHVANNVVVANCQYYGGGMRISPRSYPGDGLLDVQVSIGSKSEAFTLIPKLYRGEHIPSPNIKELRGAHIAIEADRPLPVEADGEPLGTTPAMFTVLPQALRLKV
jgi:YegS/Rv2252/BmrU family lipid kinase